MASIGTIKQFKGPFDAGYTLPLQNGNCKIGISIGEKDFMRISQQNSGFKFVINGEQLYMGRTCMYQSDRQIDNVTISFPQGAPLSTIVDVVYMDREI